MLKKTAITSINKKTLKRRLTQRSFDGLMRTSFGATRKARLAQLVEQGIENPRVRGSIPRPGTIS